MATAELAACLPVLLIVLGVVLTAVAVVGTKVRLQDAAREVARATARGDDAAAHRLVEGTAAGAQLSVTRSRDDVTAVARARVQPLGHLLPSFEVSERAVAATEPDDGATSLGRAP